jgi:hypothetical protein
MKQKLTREKMIADLIAGMGDAIGYVQWALADDLKDLDMKALKALHTSSKNK